MRLKKRSALLLIGLLFILAPGQTYEGGFATPLWDSTARWEIVRLGGCEDMKLFLEGQPRGAAGNAFGFSYTEPGTIGPGYLNAEGGRSFIGWFELDAMRMHAVAGSSTHGYLDGPFSRARFGTWHYTWHPGAAFSRDGRYLYMTDKSGSRHSLRKLDFEQQVVTTLLPSLASTYRGLATGADGRLYALASNCMLMVFAPDGQVEKTVQLDTTNGVITGFTPHALPITIDDVHNRLYCNQSTRSWYVSYWDLTDLSFHGVVPISTVRRGRNAPGSFEGVDWYGEGSHVSFGPDDPNKRFLYTARNDTWEIFRLDLDRQWVSCVRTTGGTNGQPTIMSFVDTLPISKIGAYASFRWTGNGSFLAGPRSSALYKRIQ